MNEEVNSRIQDNGVRLHYWIRTNSPDPINCSSFQSYCC